LEGLVDKINLTSLVAVLNQIPTPSIIATFPEEKILFVNDLWCQETGHCKKEFVGSLTENYFAYQNPETKDLLTKELTQQGIVKDQEISLLTKQKKKKAFLVSQKLIQVGDLTCVLTTLNSLSKEKNLIDKLAESEAQVRTLINSTEDLMWLVEPKSFGLLSWNMLIEDFFRENRNIKLKIGDRPEDVFPAGSDDIKLWKSWYKRAKKESFSIEYSLNEFNLILKMRINQVIKDGLLTGISVIGQDITESKKIEKMYQDLFTWSPFAVALHEIICDDTGEPMDYRFLAVNPAFECFTGLKAENVIGRTVLDIIPNLEKQWINTYGRVALTGEPAFFESFSEGLGKHCEVIAFRNAPGEFFCCFNDITTRKQMEEELRRFKIISDKAVYGKAIVDLSGHLVYVNNFFANIHGYKAEELIGQPLSIFHTQIQMDVVNQNLSNITQSGYFETQEIWHVHRNGTEFPMLMNGTMLSDEQGVAKYIATSAVDITRLKQAEITLQESETEKLAIIEKKLLEQNHKLSGLYELVLISSDEKEKEELILIFLNHIITITGCQAVGFYKKQDGRIRLETQLGLCEEEESQLEYLGRGEELWTQKLMLMKGKGKEVGFPDEIEKAGYQACALVMIDTQQVREFGSIVYLWKNPHEFKVDEIALLTTITNILGVILENRRLRQLSQETAMINERRRMALDLHDSVSQSLNSLIYSAETASKVMESNPQKLGEVLKHLTASAMQALKDLRLLMYELRLVPCDEINLVEVLRMRLDAVETRANIKAKFCVDKRMKWPKAWERELYPIAMEALNNALRHGCGNEVEVRIRKAGGIFCMSIRDNGRGFEMGKEKAGGMGLKNMAERAERLGGRLVVISNPGSGTFIEIYI
jgi:PAS domain S-box-containing protein